MPPTFVLRNPDGTDNGVYRADQFGRNSNGEYVCAGHGGSPLFLRVIKQRDNHLLCLSEDRKEQREYEMVPFTDPGIAEVDGRPVASVPGPFSVLLPSQVA